MEYSGFVLRCILYLSLFRDIVLQLMLMLCFVGEFQRLLAWCNAESVTLQIIANVTYVTVVSTSTIVRFYDTV